MPFITYNPTIHDPTGYSYNTASSYAIWGAAWDEDGIASTDKSIVPSVRMYYDPNLALANERRRASSNAALPNLDSRIMASLSVLRTIPQSRRVLFPNYLQDDGLGGNDLDNFNVYKTYTSTNMTIGGAQFDSPFQYSSTGPSQTKESSVFLAAYLDEVEKNNAHFSYIADDFESYSAWSAGGVRLTGGTRENWQSPGDARAIGTIVQDPRFIDPTKGDVTRNLSWSAILQNTYAELTGVIQPASTTMQQWLNRTSNTDYQQPWGLPTSYYSWDKTLRQVCETHRVEYIFKQVLDKPWFEGVYSNYDTFNNTYADWKYLRDYNTHYGLLGGLLHPHKKVCASPVLYGEIGQIANWGYVTNPTNDMDTYRFAAPGATVTSFTNLAYQAFVLDMQKIRSVIRQNIGKSFQPWVRNPSDTVDNCKYYLDPRYWNELIFHAALSNANPFLYFQSQNLQATPLHNCLTELKGITKNGTFLPCSNNAVSTTVASDLIPLKETLEKGIISGGRIVSGPLKGQTLWRITVPPQVIGGTGSTLVTLTDTKTVTINSTTRGAWYLSDTRPVIASITGT